VILSCSACLEMSFLRHSDKIPCGVLFYAPRCIGLRSTLHRPTLHVASAYAPRCIGPHSTLHRPTLHVASTAPPSASLQCGAESPRKPLSLERSSSFRSDASGKCLPSVFTCAFGPHLAAANKKNSLFLLCFAPLFVTLHRRTSKGCLVEAEIIPSNLMQSVLP